MAIVNGLCTLEQVRKSLSLKDTDTALNSDIEDYISAATPLIEQVTGPMYARAERFQFDGGGFVLLVPMRFNTVITVTINGAAVMDFTADSQAGLIWRDAGWPYEVQSITVVVQVGYATIPPNIVLAARECVRELWQIGRQGNRPSFGNEVADASTASQGYVMSNRVRALCATNDGLPGFA